MSLGKIHFSTKYVGSKLEIKIIECQGLKDVDFIGKSDPYVCLYILPGKHEKLQTKVVNNSSNPVFVDKNTFGFTLEPSQIRNKWAVFQVFDKDIGKDEKLGEARYQLADMNLEHSSETHHWLDLAAFSEVPPHVRGRMSTTVSTNLVSRESATTRRTSHMSSAAPSRMEYTSGSSYSSDLRGDELKMMGGYSSYSQETKTQNLRELNNRLDNIVSQNRKFEDVDTKLIINLLSNKIQSNVNGEVVLSKMDQFLQPLREELMILAGVNAEVDSLKRENEILVVRNDEIQERISERSTTEVELRNKMRRLEDDYAAKMREREAMIVTRRTWEVKVEEARGQLQIIHEKLKGLRLDAGKWDAELDIMARKTQLWGETKERFTVYFSESIDREIECPSIFWDLLKEYSLRMDEEVKKLKDMHFNYNNGIKGLEGNEVARLKNILEESGGHVDITVIENDLELIKKQMLSLEMEKVQLRMRIFELRFEFDQKELLFYAQFEAKEGALMFLKAEYEKMKETFFRQMKLAEESEISRFSRTITNEEAIIERKSRDYRSNDSRRVVMGLSLSPKVNPNDGHVDGWNIEQHVKDIGQL